MPLVIGQFIDTFSPAVDGVVNVVKSYARIMNDRYGKCYVLAPAVPNYTDHEPFEVIRFNSVPIARSRKQYRTGIPTLDIRYRQQVKSIPFDIVHAHTPFGCGLEAMRTATKLGVPLVATFHSKYYEDFKQATGSDSLAKFGMSYVVWFYRQADYVCTPNRSTADNLRSYGYEGDVTYIDNGVDAVYPPDAERRVLSARQRFNLRGAPLFLFVGQLIWHKNVRLILEALSLMQQRGQPFQMLFVGAGNARAELESLVSSWNLSENVRFTGSILDREALYDLYLAADLFLFPSLYDTSGLVVRESAAMGTPSLLVEGSSVAEGVTDGYNGYLCQENAAAMCDKMIRILSDRESLARVSEQARETLPQTWDEIVAHVHHLYSEFIRDRVKRTVSRSLFYRAR